MKTRARASTLKEETSKPTTAATHISSAIDRGHVFVGQESETENAPLEIGVRSNATQKELVAEATLS